MATVKTSKPAKAAAACPKTETRGKNGPNMAYLKEMAKELKVAGVSKFSKPELIRAIQLAEGNSDCYQRIADCVMRDCLFHIPCQQN